MRQTDASVWRECIGAALEPDPALRVPRLNCPLTAILLSPMCIWLMAI